MEKEAAETGPTELEMPLSQSPTPVSNPGEVLAKVPRFWVVQGARAGAQKERLLYGAHPSLTAGPIMVAMTFSLPVCLPACFT